MAQTLLQLADSMSTIYDKEAQVALMQGGMYVILRIEDAMKKFVNTEDYNLLKKVIKEIKGE